MLYDVAVRDGVHDVFAAHLQRGAGNLAFVLPANLPRAHVVSARCQTDIRGAWFGRRHCFFTGVSMHVCTPAAYAKTKNVYFVNRADANKLRR